jgi:hypothetical protein
VAQALSGPAVSRLAAQAGIYCGGFGAQDFSEFLIDAYGAGRKAVGCRNGLYDRAGCGDRRSERMGTDDDGDDANKGRLQSGACEAIMKRVWEGNEFGSHHHFQRAIRKQSALVSFHWVIAFQLHL